MAAFCATLYFTDQLLKAAAQLLVNVIAQRASHGSRMLIHLMQALSATSTQCIHQNNDARNHSSYCNHVRRMKGMNQD